MSNDNPVFTREVNGNECIKVGEELRDLLGVRGGDYVTIEVKAVHPMEELHE